MKLLISPEIFQKFPQLQIGALVIKGFNNNKKVSNVAALLRGAIAEKKKQIGDQDVFELPTIAPWAKAFQSFNVNPKNKMPSIAALLSRILKGGNLPEINLLVDLYNYFSLKYLLPVGGEDLDWLCGDLELTFTKGGEPFRAIGATEVESAEAGEVAYIDQAGITCRNWNYRECERTKFTDKTVNAVIFIEDLSGMPNEKFREILREMQSAIIKYVGGQIEPYILNSEKREIDFNIQGRKNFDDSRIPKQELAYLQQKQAQAAAPKKPKMPQGEQKLPIQEDETLLAQTRKLLKEAVNAAYPGHEDRAHIEYPAASEHGDYAANIALQLSKELGLQPREIAQKVLENLPENSLIQRTEIAGPGFINFFLSPAALHKNLAKILAEKAEYGRLKVGEGRKIIVEYSDPNIAKPLGIHHILATIIGQTIANLLKTLHFETVSLNYIGDWGTQFGKVIYALKTWGDKKAVEVDPIPELLKLYVEFHEKAEEDPTIEDRGREEFRKLETGDQENRELWQWIVDESMRAMNKTYEKLGGITFDHIQGEAFHEDKMDEIFALGEEKGVIVPGEEGAQVIHFEEEGLPTVPIRKKDGATLYITRDFAAINYRINHWHPEKIIYVVDRAQSLHFEQLFTASRRMELCKDEPTHVSFGRMSMKDKKMSTRKGNIILLDDVLDEAVVRAKELLQEKSPDLPDLDNAARKIGIGAVKYAILSQNRNTDIVFDWDKILTLEGNSGPYLQYTYARAHSILQKENATDTLPDPANIEEITTTLLRKLVKYQEVILSAAQEYKPNLLTNYIYELAQAFNYFYNQVPVLKADSLEKKNHRREIVQAAAQILHNGLEILGVEVLNQM